MRQPFLQRFRDHQGVAEVKPVILWMENWERDKEEPESSPLTNYLANKLALGVIGEPQEKWFKYQLDYLLVNPGGCLTTI